jgi:hypothetical protein
VAVFLCAIAVATAFQALTAGQDGSSAPDPREFVDKYCITCHNPRQRVAGLNLQDVDLAHPSTAAAVVEKMIEKLRAGEMPPPGLPRPDISVLRSEARQLAEVIDREAAARPDPGPMPRLHRLNRAEYSNAIRDLLAVDVDARELLPADDSEHGFDNAASVLSVSPALIERYLSAARRISRIAVGDPAISAASESRTYELPKTLFQNTRMSEELPFGSRGGLAVTHRFPLNGTYTISVRLQRNYVDYIRGLSEAHDLDVRLDGKLLKRFTVGGLKGRVAAPSTFAGNITGDPEWERYALSADDGMEVRVPVAAGSHTVAVTFPEEPGEAEGVLQPPQTGYAYAVDETASDPDGYRGPAIDRVLINGPFDPQGSGDTESRRRIFMCRPQKVADENSCAANILSTLSRRAYRRPVTPADVDALLVFYKEGRATRTFEAGIQRALERLLSDPDFLFRAERAPGSGGASPYRLDDVELASRLSFFLWSSIPDDELLDLAAAHRLSDPHTLESQVGRMLADKRADALTDNFAAQWLTLRALRDASPNPELFPSWDENLRDAFLKETKLFVANELRTDQPIPHLLTASYTFLNERLARHYGIPNVYGEHFRRVDLPEGPRAGLLGHGSILTVTSYGNRTSPVLRGHWVLDNLLGTPPPPPPPNVPPLNESQDRGRPMSMRERMEEHRRNPACASCHVRMDPFGFSLEHFDAVGQWRAQSEGGAAIDTSAVLPDGTRFEGADGLRQLLAARSDDFVGAVVEKLLTYALGRGLGPFDKPSVRAITRRAAANGNVWSSAIVGIVQSTPFQMRRSDE